MAPASRTGAARGGVGVGVRAVFVMALGVFFVGGVADVATLGAQQATTAGPVIQSGGAVYAVPNASFANPPGQDYRVAFEVAAPAAAPSDPNAAINSVARFLNMHAQAGVPRERVGAAMVVHGGAGFELLDDPAYRAKYGVDNPNGTLIRELIAAGTQVVLCGQTAAARGVPVDGLIPGVKVALSAMTAFLVLQGQGYRVNPW